MRGLMDEAWFVDCDLEDALAAVIARQVQSLPLRSICLYLPIAKLSMVLGLGSFKRWLQPECFCCMCCSLQFLGRYQTRA